ncbi:hypothetical protein BH10ACT10_BH10ACT10_10770 [soil metagenome]
MRAYGDAVRAGLEGAGTRNRHLLHLYDVRVGHADAGRLESDLRGRGLDVLDATYTEHVTLRLAAGPATDLTALLAELTGGTVQAAPVGTVWTDQ